MRYDLLSGGVLVAMGAPLDSSHVNSLHPTPCVLAVTEATCRFGAAVGQAYTVHRHSAVCGDIYVLL